MMSMHGHRVETLTRTVMEELAGDPLLDASRISAGASDAGVVTLSGLVRSYADRRRAERLVRKLPGVTRIVNALQVRLTIGNYRTDHALQHLVTELLQNHAALSGETLVGSVRDGHVTIRGIVSSESHRRWAEEIIGDLAGVTSIRNQVEVRPTTDSTHSHTAFHAALQRRCWSGADDLAVDVRGPTMSLRGTVGSCAEHDELIDLAIRTRGIGHVEDNITIRHQPESGRTR